MKKTILFITLFSTLFAQSPMIKIEGQDFLKALVYTENSPYVKLYDWNIGNTQASPIIWDPNGNNWTADGFERKGKVYLSNDGEITHTIVDTETKLGYWTLLLLGNKDKIIKASLIPNVVTLENQIINIDKAFIKEQVVCEENDKLKGTVYRVKFPKKLSFWVEEKTTISTQGNKSEYVITFDKKPECVTKAIANKPSDLNKISDSTQEHIKLFLKSFYKVGEESFPAKVLRYYDSKIDRYFSMKNVSKEDILEDKIRYYKKWTTRKYVLKDFEIIDSLIADGTQFYTVSTVVDWKVISAKGKSRNGTSYNIITLIENDNGFLVRAIKTLGGSTESRSQVNENKLATEYKPKIRQQERNINTFSKNRYKVTSVAYNDTLNVRTNPYATRNNKVGELLPDAKNIKMIKCKYNRKGTKWCKIQHNDYGYTIAGWVVARCLVPQGGTQHNGNMTYRVIKVPSNDTLSVRSNAGTHNRKLGDLTYYATGIRVIKCKKAPNGRKWCKVSHPSIITGWVSAKYLRQE